MTLVPALFHTHCRAHKASRLLLLALISQGLRDTMQQKPALARCRPDHEAGPLPSMYYRDCWHMLGLG